jgi:hypothetical protein
MAMHVPALGSFHAKLIFLACASLRAQSAELEFQNLGR